MIFGHPKPVSDKCLVEHDAELGEDKRPSPAIFSRAVSSPASPGAMLAIVLLTDNNQFAIADQIMTVGVMTCALAIAYLFLLLAVLAAFQSPAKARPKLPASLVRPEQPVAL